MQGINETVEFFADKVFFISFGQIMFMFLTCFLCLLYGKYKTGLLVSYFLFFTGVLFPIEFIGWNYLLTREGIGLVMYFFSATAVALMGAISFFQADH